MCNKHKKDAAEPENNNNWKPYVVNMYHIFRQKPGDKTKQRPKHCNKTFSHCHLTVSLLTDRRSHVALVVLTTLFFPEKITGTAFFFSSFALQEVFSCHTEDFFIGENQNVVCHARGKKSNQLHPRWQSACLSTRPSLLHLRNIPLNQYPSDTAWIIPTFFFSLSPKRLSFTLFRCWKALNSNSPEHTKIPCSTSLCQFLYTCTDATGRVLWKSDSMQFKAEPMKREETMMWHTCPWDEFTYSFIRIDNPPVFFITA